MTVVDVRFEPISFAEIEGWTADDHLAAFGAFLKSARRLLAICRSGESAGRPSDALASACRVAVEQPFAPKTQDEARQFFEANFVPNRVAHNGAAGLLTAYYEPVLEGSTVETERFRVPLLRRPADLVNLVEESQRGAKADALTHARRTADGGTEPYATREEIETGALAGNGLEFLWLEDPVDTFFLHIQGSGLIRLPDGSEMRIAYHGKNGHPYTSVGRYLINEGLFSPDDVSLDSLKDWLRAHPEKGKLAMWQNKSYVFFRELEGREAESALGVLEIPLTTDRSLAVDAGFHAIGTPVFVEAPTLTHAMGPGGFRRLMIAQDVGSAIRGPERGDLYFGSGDEAGRLAGITKHPGRYFVLLPKDGAAAKPTA